MEPLPVVRKRIRIWPILLAIVIIALLIAAALYLIGDASTTPVTRLLPTAGGAAVAVAVTVG